jgi:hypothetical protein
MDNVGRGHRERSHILLYHKIHIVDNLLLVHNNTSRVTMMFDIKSRKGTDRFPVASPLPIALPYLFHKTTSFFVWLFWLYLLI